MADRRLLTDDVGMLSIAESSDAARHAELISDEHELFGLEETVVCGFDTEARNEPVRFAACLARRLGWRLSLVPLPEAATQGERLGRLLAASARDQAAFVVAEAAGRDGSAAALIELSRRAACPLIAVPRGAGSLGRGPILCGIAGGGPSGATVDAASRLANAIDSRLRLVHVVSHVQPEGCATSDPRGVVWRALHTEHLAAPVDLVIDEGDPAERLGELGRREDAALLAVGAPTRDADPDGVAAAVLHASPIPVMVVRSGSGASRSARPVPANGRLYPWSDAFATSTIVP